MFALRSKSFHPFVSISLLCQCFTVVLPDTHATNTNVGRCTISSIRSAQALPLKKQQHGMAQALALSRIFTTYIVMGWICLIFHNGLRSRTWFLALRFLMAPPAYLARKLRICRSSSIAHLSSQWQGRCACANIKRQQFARIAISSHPVPYCNGSKLLASSILCDRGTLS